AALARLRRAAPVPLPAEGARPSPPLRPPLRRAPAIPRRASRSPSPARAAGPLRCVRGERRRATPRLLGAGAGSTPRPAAIVAARQVAVRATCPGRPSLPSVALRGARVRVSDVPAVLGIVL